MNEKNTERSIYLVIAIGLTLLIAKIYFYTIPGDEPWFAEQAYWLAKDGVVRSEFFSTILNYGAQQFAYHKLHIWIAAFAIKMFGLSYLVLKTITLSFFCVFLLISRRYFYGFYAVKAKYHFSIFLAFILINSLVLQMVFYYRPEIAIMCFGFIEYFFIRKSLTKGVVYVLYAGVFAGLCALMHLNGVIFIVAGFILLLVKRKIKYAFWFSVAAGIVVSFYFIDILPNHWASFWMQFRHDPAIPAGEFNISTLGGRLLSEYQRFFRHGFETAYSLLLLSVIALNYKSIWREPELRSSLIYFIALSLTLAAISPGKKNYYLLLAMPYAGILVSASLCQVFSRVKRSWKDNILTGVAVLYVIANVPHALAIINDGRGDILTPRKNAEVMRHFGMRKGDKVLAPLSFVFNSVENVNIHGVTAYFMRARQEKVKLSSAGFFKEARADHRKFILLRSKQSRMLKLAPMPGEKIESYTYIGPMHGYEVFEKTADLRQRSDIDKHPYP